MAEPRNENGEGGRSKCKSNTGVDWRGRSGGDEGLRLGGVTDLSPPCCKNIKYKLKRNIHTGSLHDIKL